MPQLRRFQVTKQDLHRRRRVEEPQWPLIAELLKHPGGMSALFQAGIRYKRAYRRYRVMVRGLSGLRALRTAYRAKSQ